MKRYTLLVTALLLCGLSMGQPKWTKNVQKSLRTLYALQQEGDTLRSQAFYIDAQGTLVAPLSIIRNARKAWCEDTKGGSYPISRICGFNSTYNVVKLQAETGKKKSIPLPLSQRACTKGQTVYLMPSGTSDQITQIEKAGNYNYYTLESKADPQLTGTPVMDENGTVSGILQTPITIPNAPNYVLDIRFLEAMSISAMDANHSDLQHCSIPKQLPADETQAKSFLFLCQADVATRTVYANNYILAFPKDPFGYIYRAELEAQNEAYDKAKSTYEEGMKAVTEGSDELLYSRSVTIYQHTLAKKNLPTEWTLQKALEDVRQASLRNPLPLYTLQEARLLFATKDYGEACHKFLLLTQTNLRTPDLFLYAAQCKENMGSEKADILALNDSAMSFFTKPYTREAANYLWVRSQTLKGMNRYRDAIADLGDYEHLLTGKLTDVFYYEREQLELKSRMYAQALNDIGKAIALNPTEPLYYAEQAVLQYRTRQTEEAMVSCQKAIELDNAFPDAYRLYGICLREKGDLEGARKQLKKAAELGDKMAQDLLSEMQ